MICGPRNSSAWKQELELPLDFRKVKVNSLWQNLDLTSIRSIHFNGGEPLLNKEHVEFLKSIPVKSQVHINYNTNGTIQPTQELMDLWSEFKLVQLDFSIDDTGQRFEYQRFPSKWDQVCDNLKWFVDHCPVNCMFAVNTTISILNAANIDSLTQWLSSNFAANRLGDLVEYRQQPASGVLATTNVDSRKTDIVRYLDSCDRRRGTNWRDTFPELIQIL
jgi:MoaA/NifB/PqqE/SkfB family radical SAM enzyme